MCSTHTGSGLCVVMVGGMSLNVPRHYGLLMVGQNGGTVSRLSIGYAHFRI